MLQIDKSPSISRFANEASEHGGSVIDLYNAFAAFFRRQYPVMVVVWVASIGLGILYLFSASPHYTGEAKLIIDSRKMQLFSQQSVLGDISVDSPSVESQVEILKSENIAVAVIRDLHLTDDPEFVSPRGGILSTVMGIVSRPFSASAAKSEFANLRRAVRVFQSNLKVKRAGLTYVIDINYTSLNPDRAAQVANALADAYIVDQLEGKYQATRRASKWLQDRIRELRDQASVAERAVLDFKQKNNIVDTGGRLMGEQQLVEINSQLVAARAQTAEAEARLERIRSIINAGGPEKATAGLVEKADPAVADSLHNEVITKLRSQYLDYSARLADLTRRVGPNHLAVINLRNQMLETRKSIFDELDRIAETYKSDYEIAKAREESIQKTLASTVAQSQTTDKAQIALHELEGSAQTFRALHDNFLQRYMEATQQESFPITEARLISPASRPMSKSQPNTNLVLMLSSVAGLLLALGVGFARELGDQVFRAGSQIESRLRADCIAVVPMVRGAKTLTLGARSSTALERSKPGPLSTNERLLANDQSMLWYVVNQPFSQFAEAIRALKVAADVFGVSKSNRVIGITSSVPNEGKSTLASSLALLMAQGGARVILIDADLRNPVLSRHLAPGARVGFVELILGTARSSEVLWTDPTTGLAFLPTVLKTRLAHTSELLASRASKDLMAALREQYDWVVVDLAPLAPVVDVRATTSFVDSYTFVVEWGRTKTDVVEHALDAAKGVYDNLLGVVLNKVNFDILSRYDGSGGNYFYREYYARYGYSE